MAQELSYAKDVAIKKKKKDANSVDHMPETLGRAEERDGLLSILRQNFFWWRQQPTNTDKRWA